MLSPLEKIEILKTCLHNVEENYADSFKTEILFFFDEFEDIHSIDFSFLNNLNSREDIYLFVDNLTSKIVLKFNEEEEQLSDFIFYHLNSQY